MGEYNTGHKQVMDDQLLLIPLVTSGQAFGYPAYKIKNKVFCFVGGDGIGLKLPKKRVSELIDTYDACHPFYPAEGILWSGWVSIVYSMSDDYRQHLDWYEESIEYVGD